MTIYIPEAEEIYFSKTREYFQEVLSSYSVGNYRSAIVMLYTVAICDILFKLQELADMYNDTVAKQILAEVEKCRNDKGNKSKSAWEKELVEHVYNKTSLLDLEAYANLSHLFDHRNLSAHPALNDNYELISPSRETTIAHIRNILSQILVKPPIFIKNIVDMLTEDLKEKKAIYQGEYDKLAVYLDNKYYSKMSTAMKKSTLKALWKFCFNRPDDENCNENRVINRYALEALTHTMGTDAFEFIKAESRYFSEVAVPCIAHLVFFMARFPEVYNALNKDVKAQIDILLQRNGNARALSWFKSESMVKHLQSLKEDDTLTITANVLQYMAKQYRQVGLFSYCIDYFIAYYGHSGSYKSANERFDYAIEPYLGEMNATQFKNLIEVSNSNPQIYRRFYGMYSNTIIVKVAKTVLGEDFKYDVYPNFKFYAENDSDEEQEASGNEELPF